MNLKNIEQLKIPKSTQVLLLDSKVLEDPVAVIPALLKKIVAQAPDLRTLNLADIKFGVEGARVLAQGLDQLKHLRELLLGNTAIGDEGVAILAKEFHKATCLEVLDLSQNAIGDTGTKALAAEIQKLLVLRKLVIKNNNISQEALQQLKAVDNGNPFLEIEG